MVLLSTVNKQRAAVGASQVVRPGQKTTAPTPVKGAAPAATRDAQGNLVNPRSSSAAVLRSEDPFYQNAGTTSAANRAGTFTQSTRNVQSNAKAQDEQHRKVLASKQVPLQLRYLDEAKKKQLDLEAKLNVEGIDEASKADLIYQINNIKNGVQSRSDLIRRLEAGAVESGDIEIASREFGTLKTNLKNKSQDPRYIDEKMKEFGFATDGTDPFAKFRDPNFNVTAYLEQLYQGAGNYADAYEKYAGERKSMALYDKIKRGEYLTPEEEQDLADHEEALGGMNEGLTSRRAAEDAKTKANVNRPGVNTVGSNRSTRINAVFDLVRQGISDPGELLDMLNFTEDGKQVGDFTLEEVAGILKSRSKSMTSLSPNGSQNPGTSMTGTPGSGDPGNPGTIGGMGSPAPARMTPTRGALGAVIAQSDPLTAGYLTAAQQMLDERAALAGQTAGEDVMDADAEWEELQSIAGSMMTRGQELRELSISIAKQNSQQDETLLKMQKEQQMRTNEHERQLNQFRMNQQKRELELSNKKRVDSYANRVAIAGGFGSMASLGEVDRIQFEGDRAVGDFVMEMSFADQSFLNRASEIEMNYTGLVTQVHRNYSNNLLSIVSSYNDRVDEIDNMLRGGSEKRRAEYRKARQGMRDAWVKLQEDSLGLIKEGVQEAGKRAEALRKEQWEREKSTWNNAFKYITVFGTQNKQQLGTFEQTLGLTPGSLSSFKTMAELKQKRYTGGGTLSPGSAQSYISTLRQQIVRAHPEWANDGEKVDSAVLQATQTNYSGTKNANFRIAVQNYVNDNNFGNEPMTYADPSKQSKPYFVSYKFHPTFEQNVIELGDDDVLSGLLSLSSDD